MPKGYDRIARYYDLFARLIFGRSIADAQQDGLSEIISGSNVLIVGGGTGYVLEHLAALNIEYLRVDYVERSEAMIELAKGRDHSAIQVNFIHMAIEDLPAQSCYDVVITQFFLDSFQGAALEVIMSKLHSHLKLGGTWILADFQFQGDWIKIWQKFLLWIMYLFFSFTVGIKAKRLEDFQQHLLRLGYRLSGGRSYYGNFIFSSTYQKSA